MMLALLPLTPLLVIAALWWVLRDADRQRQAWIDDPQRPWNIQNRLIEEHLARQRAIYDSAFPDTHTDLTPL